MDICFIRLVAAVGIFTAVVVPASAEMPSGVYSAWAESFEKSADVFGVIEHEESDGGFLCPVKSLFRLKCECEARYRVTEVLLKPEWHALKKEDRVILEYPCDRHQKLKWVGSHLPWAVRDENGNLVMKLPSSHLERRKADEWRIDNDSRVFAPVQ